MGMYNDNLILDCCMYFSRQRAAYLCSADNNLLIEAVAQGERSLYLFYDRF